MTRIPDALAELARHSGVALGYRSDRGEPIDVDATIVIDTLNLLGVAVDSDTTASKLLADEHQRHAADVLPPVVVAWDGRLPALTITADAVVTLSLHGSELPGVDLAGTDPANRTTLALVHDGAGVVAADPLPTGYHRLTVHAAGLERDAVVISAPRVPRRLIDVGRRWGVFCPLYALRSAHTPSVGDLSDLTRLIALTADAGGSVVLTLPLLPVFLDEPADPSPYAPASRLFWNELHLDLRHLPRSDGSDAPAPEPGPPPDADGFIDYAAVWAHHRQAIQAAADAFFATGGGQGEAFARFVAQQPLVHRYAAFRGTQARYGRNWRDWPARARDGHLDPTDPDPAVERFHLYAQFALSVQLTAVASVARGRDVLLGLDLALGCHPDGFDVWHEGSLFVTAASVGAPPDAFFTLGQDWGFPPVHPAASRRSGHAYIRACLQSHLRYAGLLRIDHVMALYRLYWLSQGRQASRGTYVSYPAEELFAVACLEADRADAVVIGENLGTVPPEIDHLMAEHRFLGTYVAQDRAATELGTPPTLSIASVNTHDMPTFGGWWTGIDIDDRARLGLFPESDLPQVHADRAALASLLAQRLGAPDDRPDEVLDALLGWIARSDAAIALVTLEDLWLEPRPHNVPGTSTERPNWRRVSARTLEEIAGDPDVARRLGAIAALRPS